MECKIDNCNRLLLKRQKERWIKVVCPIMQTKGDSIFYLCNDACSLWIEGESEIYLDSNDKPKIGDVLLRKCRDDNKFIILEDQRAKE
jgi:hypothetical protein